MAGADMVLQLVLQMKDEATDKMQKVEKSLGGVNKAALALGAGAVVAVGAFAKGLYDCVQAAAEEEIGMVKLQTAVKNTGFAFEQDAVNAMEAYIAAAQRRTAFDDGEQRQSLTNLTNATGHYSSAMNLLPIAMDLARSKGMDLVTASDLVGKVANGNTGIMARYGIVIQEGATAQEALAAMQAKFAGQADAYGKTFAGQSELLSQQMGNLKETIGGVLLPVVTSLMTNFATFAGELIPKVEAALAEMQPIFETVFAVVQTVVTTAWSVIQPIFDLFAGWFSGPGTETTTGWGATVNEIFTLVQEIIETVMPIVQQVITDTLNAIKVFWDDHGQQIMAIVSVVFAMIQNTITTVINVIRGVLELVLALIKGDWQGAWNAILGIIETVWNGIKTAITLAVDLIRNYLALAWSIIRDAASAAWQAVKDAIVARWEEIKATVTTAVESVRVVIGTAWSTIHTGVQNAWATIARTIAEMWAGIRDRVRQDVEAVRLQIGGEWNRIYQAAQSAWGTISSTIGGAFNSIFLAAEHAFNAIRDRIMTPMQQAADFVSEIINSIKRMFTSLSGFHVPMPHFTAGTRWVEVAGIGFNIPDIGVSWYKKGLEGMVFDKPTLIGVGEAGPERVSVTPLGAGGGSSSSQTTNKSDYTNTITITGNTFIVRTEADIERIAREIVTQVMRQQGQRVAIGQGVYVP